MAFCKPENCDHGKLYFGSGDYYLFCEYCGANWARMTRAQPDYGLDKDGNPIGACPSEANQGVGASLTGKIRRKQHRNETD